MTEIIYVDIDGTLRDEKSGVPESAKEALEKCREKGIRIVICTGRNKGSIQEDVTALETDGIVSGGGCRIEMKGAVWKEESFPLFISEGFLELIERRRLGASLETERELYMNRRAAEFYRADFAKKLRGCYEEEEIRRNRISYRDNFGELGKEKENLHKACLMGNREEIEEAERYFLPYAETVQKKEWNGEWYLELLPKGCGKGSAVRLINSRLGIRRENSMSFGDGDNDVDMLKATGVGVAVEGAGPELLAWADTVCEAPERDGIYKELKRRGIIGKEEKGDGGNEKTVVAEGDCLSDLSKELL